MAFHAAAAAQHGINERESTRSQSLPVKQVAVVVVVAAAAGGGAALVKTRHVIASSRHQAAHPRCHSSTVWHQSPPDDGGEHKQKKWRFIRYSTRNSMDQASARRVPQTPKAKEDL